jgi:plastocyanin
MASLVPDRRTHRVRIVLPMVLVLVVVALVVVGCASSSGGGLYGGTAPVTTAVTQSGSVATNPAATGGGSPTTATPAGGNAVAISGNAFSPASLTVKVGDTITWTNNDSVSHTVTADDRSFDSGSLAQGASFSFTYQKAGTYTYHCSIHPSMTATVVVQ